MPHVIVSIQIVAIPGGRVTRSRIDRYACIDLSGKKPYRQAGNAMVVTSRILGDVMVSNGMQWMRDRFPLYAQYFPFSSTNPNDNNNNNAKNPAPPQHHPTPTYAIQHLSINEVVNYC